MNADSVLLNTLEDFTLPNAVVDFILPNTVILSEQGALWARVWRSALRVEGPSVFGFFDPPITGSSDHQIDFKTRNAELGTA